MSCVRRTWPILLTLAAACGGSNYDSMVHIRPPNGWDSTIRSLRESKDEAFRTSADTPLLSEDVPGFKGLDYWPPNPAYYFAGPIHVYPERRQFEIITTAGQVRPCEQFGWIDFPLAGAERRLQVYRLLDSGLGETTRSLMLPFADGTTGTETYPSGRYVDIQGPEGEIQIAGGGDRLLAVGPFVVDFNRAYNPSCAYGAPERFACPVTPAENRLDVRVEAGERGFKLPPGETAG